jgi:hypothetical protein
MKNLSKICQQLIDGECTNDQFINAITHALDDLTTMELHTLATYIVGGEWDE